MCFRVPHLCSKIPKIYNWSMASSVHSVCFCGDSPLRQWLDSYAKTRLINVAHVQALYSNTILFCCWLILLSSLYIELALVCRTNPDNVHCFGTVFPNLNPVFVSICATRPVHIPTNTEVAQLPNNDARWVLLQAFIPMGSNQKQRSGSVVAKWHDIYTPEECADELRQNNADLKLLENCVMNGLIIFGIMFMTATGLENSPHSFDVYTVSQSRSVVTSAENPAPDNSPQSIGELCNWHVANLQELYYIPDWFEKWRDIKFWYMC